MRQTTNSDGLSNSAILSLSRDSNGYLWIGTCDGINIADGSSMIPFSSYFPGLTISGNIIETIVNVGNGKNWVLTNYALDFVDTKNSIIRSYPQFHGQELICYSSPDNLFVLGENGHLFYYDATQGTEFEEIAILNHPFRDVKSISMRGDTLWFVAADGIYIYTLTSDNGETPKIASKRKVSDRNIIFSKPQGNDIFIIDSDGIISKVSSTGQLEAITDISEELNKRGSISDLVHDHQGNFFISFSTDGAMWVGINDYGEFQAVDLGMKVGVFCLEQSPEQDVVWIGSDCQGVYTYWDDQYSIRSFDFSLFDNKMSHPVRAVHIDRYKNLWLGTKGDGALKIRNFNEYYPRPGLNDSQLYTSSNSALGHNAVFAFCESSRPILWIATEEGLNYFNYKENKIFTIPQISPEIKYVHGIYEENDSTLWIVTLGQGVIKARITGSAEHPRITDIKAYHTADANLSTNLFFAMATDSDGNTVFCNRGKGVFEIKYDKLIPIPLKKDFGIPSLYDVFDAIKEGDTLWIGTGHGLIRSMNGEEQLFFGPEKGFANNTIHEMLRSADGDIWMSTNKGLVRFNPSSEESETYGRNYGLTVTEFSDGAGFNTGSALIFGGINGITIVTKNENYTAPKPFCPELTLSRLEIAGHGVPVSEHLELRNGTDRLTFEPNQNHFTLSFAAPDFINAYSYSYFYTLDGEKWINNGPDPTISFNEMNHGSYTLKVKYINRATGYESETYAIHIKVKAPWYLSDAAKMIYLIIFISLLIGAVYVYLQRQRKKQREAIERLRLKHREEVYEEKLKFFTNITHEFCTPLTLIYGPCERILTYPGSDDYIRKYVELIRGNTERLNTLIQELIDFRRIETGHMNLKIRSINMSDLCNDTFHSFTELADRNNIEYVNEIAPDIIWNSDFSSIRKILNNLISNAFKYTSPGGTIKVTIGVDGDHLRISVYNTGKGIRQEDKERIFNHYSVLDNVEENAIKGISNRNGLGMAICHSMVEMLCGSITIESEVGKFAEFIVSLPDMETTEALPEVMPAENQLRIETNNTTASNDSSPISITDNPATGETILVIDDNKEILTLLCDALADYNVVTAESAEAGLQTVRQTPPSLIISDIMMPGVNGVDFTRQLKGNRHTMHIPIILLSAKNSNEEKVEGIESGADAYIGKPFSLSYLKAVVKRLLENQSRLKEYYNTSASAFEYSEGRLRNREEKEYLESIVSYIDEHMDDSELSPEQLALHLNTSVRNLYRKFKELGEVTPNDFIKNRRMAFAAKLLQTTSMTVQEIIYRCGFTNRSHFYKEFDKRYGMTPKDYRMANRRKDSSLEDSNG